MKNLSKTIKQFQNAGYNVVPFNPNTGRAMITYSDYYEKPIPQEEFDSKPATNLYRIQTQYFNGNKLAGTLVCLDIDYRDSCDTEQRVINMLNQTIPNLLDTSVRSPSGGLHIWLKFEYKDIAAYDENDELVDYDWSYVEKYVLNVSEQVGWKNAYTEDSNITTCYATIVELKTGTSSNLTMPYSEKNGTQYLPINDVENFAESIPTINVEQFKAIIDVIRELNEKPRVEHKERITREPIEYSGDLYGYVAYNSNPDFESDILMIENEGTYRFVNETNSKIEFENIATGTRSFSIDKQSGVSNNFGTNNAVYGYGESFGQYGKSGTSTYLTPIQRLAFFEFNGNLDSAKKYALELYPKNNNDTTVSGNTIMNEQQNVNELKDNLFTTDEEGAIVSRGGMHKLIKRRNMRNRPRLPMLLEGNFRKGQVGILYGIPQTRKTFLILRLVYDAILGKKFLNQFQFNEECTVVYNPGEDVESINVRMAAYEKDMTEEELEIVEENLYVDENIVQLNTGKNVLDLIDLYKTVDVDIVVIDTLGRATIGSEENSATAMNEVMHNAATIAKELDCYVLIIHHAKKDGTEIRGNSAIEGALDQLYRIDWNQSTGYGEIKVEKMKNHAFWGPIGLKQEIVELETGETSLVLHPVDMDTIPLAEDAPIIERIAQILKLNPKRIFTLDMLCEVLSDDDDSIKRDSVRKAADRLCRDNRDYTKKSVSNSDVGYDAEFHGKTVYFYSGNKIIDVGF